MSQMTATARALRTPVGLTRTSRPARTRTTSPARSRPDRVSVAAPVSASSVTFAALCVALLVAGLAVVLLLNTSMAKGAFVLARLQSTSTLLADEQNALQAQAAHDGSSAELMSKATAMGMVPSTSSGYIRVPDGRMLGVATPAKPILRPTVMTQALKVGRTATGATSVFGVAAAATAHASARAALATSGATAGALPPMR